MASFEETVLGTIWAGLELVGKATAGQHDRVAAGGLTMAAAPTTVMEYYAKFAAFVGEFHEILGLSNLHTYFWVLVYSSFFDPDFWTNGGYAYNNFIADKDLQSGAPDGIFAYVDLLTWEGWLWGLCFWVVWHTYVYLSSGVLAIPLFMVWYAFNTDIPLCEADDFADNFFKTTFDWDLCAYAWMQS